MTRTSFILIVLASVAATTAFAAGIDGKWLSEMKVGRGDREFTMKVAFDLKTAGDQITGAVTSEGRMGQRTSEIKDGKLDGNKFSFTTVGQGRGGNEVKIHWEGTLEGDELKGQQEREGGNFGPIPFTAKRQ